MKNSITIVGYVGQNPTTKTFLSGKKVVKFSVAVKQYLNSQEDPKPIWYDVHAYNGLGDTVLSYITKGREVIIQGRLMLQQYKDKKTDYIMVRPIIDLSGYHLWPCKPSTTPSESQMGTEIRPNKSKNSSAK